MRHVTRSLKTRNSLALLMLLFVAAACTRHRPKNLITLVEPAKIEAPVGGALVSRADVRIDPAVLVPGEPARIRFPLSDIEESIVLDLEPVSPESLALPEDQHAWVGRSPHRRRSSVPLPAGSEAFFMLLGDLVEARVQLGHMIYRLRSRAPTEAIQEVYDDGRIREHPEPQAQIEEVQPDGSVVPDGGGGAEATSADSPCQDPADQIDVMVLYTKEAAEAAEGATELAEGETLIENEVSFAIAQANLAYANSKVTHQLNLVHKGLVPEELSEEGYDGEGGTSFLSYYFASDFKIRSLRESTRADLVVLLYEFENYEDTACGLGDQKVGTAPWEAETDAGATRQRAFSVVRRWCAGASWSLAHEVGHNMGAYHERSDTCSSSTSADDDFNRGHVERVCTDDPAVKWRTVMTTINACGTGGASGEGGVGGSCPRVAYFSNPNEKLDGDATGVADKEDNVRMLEDSAEEVSRYRCLLSGDAANVWMKDRWADEGGEPDSATAGLPMWQSPYVWVRHSEDKDLDHEHVHQNPAQGQTNHVYVKLHNNGNKDESAKLELYFAEASTNPTSWTLIGSQNRTVKRGVDVAKFEWPNVPDSADYSLLAHWNIDDKPLPVTNLGDAVRADNDLIWRSTKTIELRVEPVNESVFHVAGDAQSEEMYYLLITTEPMSRRQIDWDKLATASIQIDPRFDEGHLTFEGVSQTVPGSGKFEFELRRRAKKLIGPFVLQRGERSPITLTTNADLAAAKDVGAKLANPVYYDITVMQILPAGAALADNPSTLLQGKGLVTGGVSYTLRVPVVR